MQCRGATVVAITAAMYGRYVPYRVRQTAFHGLKTSLEKEPVDGGTEQRIPWVDVKWLSQGKHGGYTQGATGRGSLIPEDSSISRAGEIPSAKILIVNRDNQGGGGKLDGSAYAGCKIPLRRRVAPNETTEADGVGQNVKILRINTDG